MQWSRRTFSITAANVRLGQALSPKNTMQSWFALNNRLIHVGSTLVFIAQTGLISTPLGVAIRHPVDRIAQKFCPSSCVQTSSCGIEVFFWGAIPLRGGIDAFRKRGVDLRGSQFWHLHDLICANFKILAFLTSQDKRTLFLIVFIRLCVIQSKF